MSTVLKECNIDRNWNSGFKNQALNKIKDDVVDKSTQKHLADRFGHESSTRGRRKRWPGSGSVVTVNDMCSELLLSSALSLEIGRGRHHSEKLIFKSFSVVRLITAYVYGTQCLYENHYLNLEIF